MTTAHYATGLSKPLMALPGPVTSAQSAGCHQLIRTGQATCVTSADDILDVLSPAAEATVRQLTRLPG